MRLHQNSVPYEGTTGAPVRPDLPLPPNLYVIGTINIDETTNPLSNKVLDRALIIDLSAIDLAGFLDQLEAREPALAESVAAVRERLTTLETVMAAEGLGFGYRVAEEVVRYQAFATGKLGAPADEVADELMVQKVLVKLRGGERQRSMLTSITKVVVGLPRSSKVLAGLISDLDEYNSFQATR